MTDTTETTTTETSAADTATVEDTTTVDTADTTTTEDTTDTSTDAADTSAEGDDDATALGGKTEGEDDKPDGDEEEAPEGPPETYELSLKDADGNDLPLDEASVEQASEVFRDLGLNNEQANKLLPVASDLVQRTSDQVLKQVTDLGAQQRKDWLAAAKADETLGGKNWEKTLDVAGRGMDALGYPEGHEFRTLLNETGFGNNPHMIAMMHKIGEIAGEEGSFARSNSASENKVPGWEDRYETE